MSTSPLARLKRWIAAQVWRRSAKRLDEHGRELKRVAREADTALRHGERMDALDARLATFEAGLGALGQRIDELVTAPPVHPDDVGRVRALAEDAEARADYALAVAQDGRLPARISAFEGWLELAPPAEGPLVSIVLATRDRPALLRRAIASVLGQRYGRWQLLVVDDGTIDRTATVANDAADRRLELLEGPRRGLSAARNVGLHAARGDIVCYLDDDNVMHPAWLQAVVHVFERRDDVDVLYGVSITEHRIPDTLTDDGWWPGLWQLPWSRDTLLEQNVTDAGALAHRRTLEDAMFDESVESAEDWELLLRLTTNRPALAVPAISHAYTITGVDRKSLAPEHGAGLDQVRQRHAGS